MKRVHDSLSQIFQRHRLVFWYDPTGEWQKIYSDFSRADVTKIAVAQDEFGTKVRIIRDRNPVAKFLIYVPTSRPVDAENWLLDLLLQGYEYKADKASLALQEVGLPHEFRHLAEDHAAYFLSGKRTDALKSLIRSEDESPQLRLKMMSVLANTSIEMDALLLHFLGVGFESDPAKDDPIVECFGPSALVGSFWKEVEQPFDYTSSTPSLRDFVFSLFRGANPLDEQVTLPPHAKVFLQRWKDSQTHCGSFRLWSQFMAEELQVAPGLERLDEKATLGDWDTFEIFEKFTLHRLCQSFAKGEGAIELRAICQERRSSFWQKEHSAGYAALEQAIELRELLVSADLTIDSIPGGVKHYTTRWWQVDQAYRICNWNLRRYGQIHVMEQVSKWVEKAYVNNFLLPLADRWSDQVRQMESWQCPEVVAQRRFFECYVQPFVSKGQKVVVIISDALRYEAAADFADRLTSSNRWTAELKFLFGSLPSYTQLGMAALLPGQGWEIDAGTAMVSINGRSATGTSNRSEILKLAMPGRAIAIQAEEFLELNSKTDGRALMRDHDVIYVYHNVIDKTGDSSTTEARTFDAVESAFLELDQLIKKVANINGSNMLVTSDHGFLFQQDDVDENDTTPLPAASSWTFRNRRFAIGEQIVPQPNVKIFTSRELGIKGEWSAAFPLSLNRFPLQGSGKRYVHGGISLQEIVIPVIKINKTRTDDLGKVEVEFVRVPAKITTGQLSISLFQDREAIGKVQPRILRVGIFGKDGSQLSDLKTHAFDSKETEARQRETGIILTLSHLADSFNNQEVELRLEELISGTSQIVTYKSHRLKLQKPFASDFDEH